MHITKPELDLIVQQGNAMNTATARLIKFVAAQRTADRATAIDETPDFRDGLFIYKRSTDMEIRRECGKTVCKFDPRDCTI